MDRRRAAGALLALAACIACSAAAPTASNHTALDLYESAPEGCYYNFQHYGEGDRIMTNEPCLNCTCHNRMLMCYLRVCPFTKPIGQDCTVEKRADQCCPIVTCPDVPVDLLTSTSTSSPAEYGATGLGKLDKYGCSINGKYFPEGSKVPPTPNKPCEHCYCIRNMTTCVMQECTLHVDGCTPIYHKDVCCPVRYSCDHPEDEMPLLDYMSTTVRPTPGFLLTTTTLSPVTQMTQDCVHNDQVIADGASITTDKACEHCYCMKGDIVCVVQECGAPMENEGKNCTSLPPREGQCCPDTYICEGDELSTEISTEPSTETILENLTTLSPPRRGGIEGSGYRHEPSEGVYTETPTAETELEGSGEEEEPTKSTGIYEPSLPGKPIEPDMITPALEDHDQYIPVTTKTPTFEEPETATKEFDSSTSEDHLEQGTIEPESHISTSPPLAVIDDEDKLGTSVTGDENLIPHEHVTETSAPEVFEKVTTESISLHKVPDVLPTQEHEKPDEYTPLSTSVPTIDDSLTTTSDGKEGSVDRDSQTTQSPLSQETPVSGSTPSQITSDNIEKDATEKSDIEPEHITEKEVPAVTDSYGGTTVSPAIEEGGIVTPKETEEVTFAEIMKDKESSKPYVSSTTSIPVDEIEKLTTEPDHAQNTVAVAEDGYVYPHPPSSEDTEKTPSVGLDDTDTEKVTKDDSLEYHEGSSTQPSISEEGATFTAEPDKGLNTIPSEIDEESSSQTYLEHKTTDLLETTTTKSTDSSAIMHVTESQDIDIKPSTSGSPTPSETHITKVDQYTITTEPSFRREDEIRVTTEKLKEEPGATTIKAEFVDEGLIPTSGHDDKPSTGSDVSTIDEEITTMLPEYSHSLEETGDIKHSTTESAIVSPDVSASIPEKPTTATSEQEGGVTFSTEKSAEVTVLIPDVDAHEEPSRIPGEGDCLLNGITYRNSTVVPSTNNCHTGCKCVSSIIKCDPIICSPPPDYMDNCQSIYDTPDSCCPTYVCDHPKETIPPQSDNQMSGTEPPVAPPVIECRGDQCEISEPAKQTDEPSEPCTSESCLDTGDHECGPNGCDSVVKKPQPSAEEPGCTDGKCGPESCAHGDCQLPPTQDQASPVKPCEGEDCKVTGDEVASPQQCKNEDDCKIQKIPDTQTVHCEGDSCKNIDCGSGGCTPGAILPPQDNQQEPCKEEDGCKPQEITPSDCTGDTPCRRKDTPTEELPSKCENGDCLPKTDTTYTQEPSKPEQRPLDEATESVVPTEGEKLSESTESYVPEHDKLDTTPTAQFVTEKVHTPTEHVIYETTEPELKVDEVTQEVSGMEDISTDEPSFVHEEETKKPVLPEEEDQITEKPIATEDIEKPHATQEEEITKKPEFIEQIDKTETPNVVEDEHTGKPTLIAEEGTKKPDVDTEKQTIKPTLPEKEEEAMKEPGVTVEAETGKPDMVVETGTKIPDALIEEQTGKPAEFEEISTKIPEIGVEEETSKPGLYEEGVTKEPITIEKEITDEFVPIGEEYTKIPDIEEGYTEEPSVIEHKGTKIPDIEEETGKPVIIAEEGTKVPDSVTDEHTDKSVSAEDETTKRTDIAEGYTDEPSVFDETGTKLPDIGAEEQTGKPAVLEEDVTKMPVVVVENQTSKPAIVEGIDTKTPEDIVEEQTGKPDRVEETGTKMPSEVVEGPTGKPDLVDEIGTKMPEDLVEEHTDKPVLVEETDTKMPDDEVEKQTGKPGKGEEVSTKIPGAVVEEQTDKPELIEEKTTKASDVGVEEQTSKPDLVEEEYTKKPSMIDEEHTDELIPIGEEYTKTPDTTEIYTDEPSLVENEGTKTPDIDVEEKTEKPVIIQEEDTKIPDMIVDEHTDKLVPTEEEHTRRTDIAENYTDEPAIMEETGTKLPATVVEEQTDNPIVEEEITKTPHDAQEQKTHKPDLVDEYATKIPDVIVDEQTSKPTLDEEGTKVPDTVVEDKTDKPSVDEEEETKKPADTEEEHTEKIQTIEEEGAKTTGPSEGYTDEPTMVEESGTRIPNLDVEEYTGKPTVDEDIDTKVPEQVTEEHTDRPTVVEEAGTKIPEDIVEEETAKPSTVGETGTKTPGDIVEKQTDKPVLVEEIGTKVPDYITEEHTSKPVVEDIAGTKLPGDVGELYTDKPVVEQEASTKVPEYIEEEQTSKPVVEDFAGTKLPGDVGELYTDKPVVEQEASTKVPEDIEEEQTSKPVITEEMGTRLPDDTVQEQTDKPTKIEETSTKISDESLEEQTVKPTMMEEAGTKVPGDIEEEHTEKPGIAYTPDIVTDNQDEDKEKPISTGHEVSSDKPTVTEEEPKDKPSIDEDNITEISTLDGEGTEMPEITEVGDTKKPMLIDESTLAPAEIEYGTETKSPIATDEERTIKPPVSDDKTTDVPAVVEEGTEKPVIATLPDLTEHTGEPQISEVYTESSKPSEEHKHIPEHPEDEDTRPTEPSKDVKVPDSSVEEHTVMTEEATRSPISESQTLISDDVSHTESYIEPIATQEPEKITPSEPHDDVVEYDKTTIASPPKTILEEKLPTTVETYQPSEHVTSPEEPLTKATKMPEYTTESVAKITKSTESVTVSEQEEIYTDMPEQDSSVTKSPISVIIEPQDSEPSLSPDDSVKGPVDEESTIKEIEKDTTKPESYVTGAIPEYVGTSAVPESQTVKMTEIPEIFDTDTQKTEVFKPQDTEPGQTLTTSSEDVGENDKKPVKPEIYTPEKEEMLTSPVSAVTEPVRGFTEIEDAYVTGQGEPFATEKTDESSETLTSSSETTLLDTKTTAVPEESYTERPESHTEKPTVTETQSTDIHVPHEPEISTIISVEVSTATQPSELPEKIPEHSKPVTGDQDLSTETAESDTRKPDITDEAPTGSPVSIGTEPHEEPIVPDEDIYSEAEKTTKSPDVEISTITELYVTAKPAATEKPESHITVSVETEPSKPTESSYVKEHVTEAEEADIKSEEPQPVDIQKPTTSPDILEKPTETQAPEYSETGAHDQDKKEHPADEHKPSTEYPVILEESHTELHHAQSSTEAPMSLVTEKESVTALVDETATEKQDTLPTQHETHIESQERVTEKLDSTTSIPEVTTSQAIEEITKSEQTSAHVEFSETTPYLIELEEHTHKIGDDISTTLPAEEEDHTSKVAEDVATSLPIEEDHTRKSIQDTLTTSLPGDEHTYKAQEQVPTTLSSIDDIHKATEDISTVSHSVEEFTTVKSDIESHSPEEITDKNIQQSVETATKKDHTPSDELSTISVQVGYQTTLSPEEATDKLSESSGVTEPTRVEETTSVQGAHDIGQKDVTTAKSIQEVEESTTALADSEKPVAGSDIIVPTEKETPITQKPSHPHIHLASDATTVPEDELILSTTKATTIKEEEILTPIHEDKYGKPEEKPTSEIIPPSTTAEIPKPPAEMQPTDEIPTSGDDGSSIGYGEPDYVEEDQTFGPGTCRYGGKVYVSAQQIPRDDPCDFCFCFRSDIICLQQSCPPPIHGCHEEPIQGFCCPRYECPVSMATTVNVTTTTTTTTTTLPPHFPTHSYKGAAQRRGCQIKGHTYKVGEVVRSSSGPCLHCTCGGDGQMKCDPKACTPEPMLRQMIAAAVSAKRRR